MARKTIRGNVDVVFFPLADAPSNLAAVTATEISTDGDNITGVAGAEAISEMSGWESSPSTIAVPDVLSLTTGNIPGETTFGTGVLTYYTDDTTNAVWDLLTEGTAGYVAIFPFGTGSGKAYTIFPVDVISRSRMLATGNEAEKHSISFAIKGRTEGEQAA